VHRTIRETPLVRPPHPARVGLDIFDLAGRLVGSADNWGGIIDMLGTLSHGEYRIVCSAGKRLAVASVDRNRGPTLRLYTR
jgi:hypothetical protein